MIDNVEKMEFPKKQVVVVAQLVRALDCGSRGCRFDPGLPPQICCTFTIKLKYFLILMLMKKHRCMWIMLPCKSNTEF